MRTWIATVFSLTAFFGATSIALAYDVSYTPITSTASPLVCPANATLNGSMCYCNSGYNMSGGICVKVVVPPPAQFEIYEDILMTITVNDGASCVALGITAPVDKDMCQRYEATSPDKRDTWKSIPRPSSDVGVANPWAPAGAQTLFNQSQGIAPTKAAAPAATTTPPAATSTPNSTTDATSTPPNPDIEKEKIGKALEKVLDDRSKPKSSSSADTSTPAPTPADAPAPPPATTTADGPSQALIDLSKKLVADAAAAAEASSTPEPVTPSPADTQTAQAAKAVDSSAEPQDFISRLIGFFRWLF